MNFTSAQSENLSPKEGITGLSLSPSPKERSLRGPTPRQNTYRNFNEILKRKVFRECPKRGGKARDERKRLK